MGEFKAGNWILGLLIYFFLVFIAVSQVVIASGQYGITTTARFDDPGFHSATPFGTDGVCSGTTTLACSLTRANSNDTCEQITGCEWNPSVSLCLGTHSFSCTTAPNATVCRLLNGCLFTDTEDIPDQTNLADTGSISNIKTTLSIITGIGASEIRIGIPPAFVYIFSFLFFWIEFFMLLWALYMALPFFH